MARHSDFVLIGGGLASATAAETLRREEAKGSVLLLSDEDRPPYQRLPLSKQFLLTVQPRNAPAILPTDFYRQHDIELILGARVIGVDPQAQTVRTASAETFHYDKLLIATGAHPKRLDVPGASLSGIHTLRTEEDAEAIRRSADGARRAVIVGASFIGMEVAATLRKKGIRVTLVAKEDHVFSTLGAPSLSDFFYEYYRKHDIDLILSEEVSSFRGEGRIQEVVTESGRVLPCDLVVVGIGVVPQTEFLDGGGIAVENGIVVDRYLQASRANIFAAGDVANFFDPVFNMRHRIEHWDNAVKQGRLAAKNMLGQRIPYDEVSYFFGDVFDVAFQLVGNPDGIDERIARGSMQDRSFALFYLKDDVLRAIFSVGLPASDTHGAEALIRYRVNLHQVKGRLADPEFPLERMPSQTVLILQGGGALGAFECGAIKAMAEAEIRPDIIAGVSIGAFNGAIVASNLEAPVEALEAFWDEVAISTPDLPDELQRRALASWWSLFFGSERFFRPRWFQPPFAAGSFPSLWTSFYDFSPARALLGKYVDFSRLKNSPVRLLVGAVNVETAELEVFDSYTDELTPDHVVASGSLPPAFPWTTVDGRAYWDGGIVSNSPLEVVAQRCGVAGKRVIIVDLFRHRRPLPTNLMEVGARRDEILYAERIRNDSRTRELVNEFRSLVNEIVGEIEPSLARRVKERPRYIQLMGSVAPALLTRIIREGDEGEQPSCDYDFSIRSLARHRRAGYDAAKRALSESREASVEKLRNPVPLVIT
jgi:NADPH-dependent 2,4-dienoyl-CoA reductase/sulfur reductase-like enzyme/predicted acylesterase/phospholipase RssA